MTFSLETERLLITPWAPADRFALIPIYSDPAVTRYLTQGRPWSATEIDSFVARHEESLARDGVCMGAARLKASGELIGVAGIQRLGTTEDFEIGWVFARAHWGNGYATEAGRVARDHVLSIMRLPRVVAIVDPENYRSIRVAEKLGLRYEGRRTGAELGHRMPEIVVNLYAGYRPDQR